MHLTDIRIHQIVEASDLLSVTALSAGIGA